MGTHIELLAADNHHFDAYLSKAPNSKMGVVVLQEIFGVNHHIRNVTDRFAAEGFTALAPAVFDRVERGAELGYDQEGMEKGRKMAYSLKKEDVLKDIEACIEYLKRETGGGKVGVVGFCFGGSYAWFSATELRPNAAVGYYGSMVAQFAQETPHCPVMLHYGSLDKHIPASDADKVRTAHPEIPVYLYDADHGFNCDERPSYNEAAAKLAWSRTIAFLKEHLAP